MTRPVIENGPVSWASYRHRIGARSELAGLRLPDFLVIAPAKTGTSWLFENLRRHPQIYMPAAKEVRYFDSKWRRHGLEWYGAQFADAGNRIAGEASPSYALLPSFAVELMHAIKPDLKLIFLMRDPVVRAWSHIKHSFRNFEGPFEDRKVDFGDLELDDLLASCVHDYPVASGDYELILKRWLKHYPAEQIFVGVVEQAFHDPAMHLQRLFQFLEVRQMPVLSDFPLRERVNQAFTDAGPPQEVRELLTQVHAPRVDTLRLFLQRHFDLQLPWATAGSSWAERPVWIMDTASGNRIFLHRGEFCRVPVDRETFPDDEKLASRLDREIAAGRVRSARYLGELDETRSKPSLDGCDDVLCTALSSLWHTDDAPIHERYEGYTIFRTGKRYVALQASAGKPVQVLARAGPTWQPPDNAIVDSSLDALKTLIDAEQHRQPFTDEPALVASVDGWNIVQHGSRWFGVEQSLGAIDFTQDVTALRRKYDGTSFVVGSSQAEVRLLITVMCLVQQARAIQRHIDDVAERAPIETGATTLTLELEDLSRRATDVQQQLSAIGQTLSVAAKLHGTLGIAKTSTG